MNKKEAYGFFVVNPVRRSRFEVDLYGYPPFTQARVDESVVQMLSGRIKGIRPYTREPLRRFLNYHFNNSLDKVGFLKHLEALEEGIDFDFPQKQLLLADCFEFIDGNRKGPKTKEP